MMAPPAPPAQTRRLPHARTPGPSHSFRTPVLPRRMTGLCHAMLPACLPIYRCGTRTRSLGSPTNLFSNLLLRPNSPDLPPLATFLARRLPLPLPLLSPPLPARCLMPSDTPPHKNSIDAFHINSAREFHRLTTGSRFPSKPLPPAGVPAPGSPSSSSPSSASSLRPPLPPLPQTAIRDAKPTPTTPKQQQSSPNTVPCSHNNPVCCHCGQVVIPAPVASLPVKDSPSICINNQWYICTQRLPILNAQEIEHFEEILTDIPVPEMIFGNNKVEVLLKQQTSEDIRFHIMFNPLDALKLVERNPEDLIQVSYADSWFKSRQLKHQNSENVSLEVYKPYDWTYTSRYKGTMIQADDGVCWIQDLDGSHAIPLDKLTSNNPIKFYDDMILYEDELGDNGISMLNIKIRVMSNCLLLLQRLFIRVDGVLVRIIDTRLYVDFDEFLIIREQKFMQDHYNDLVNKVAGPDPKKMMRDINWCSTKLPVVETTREYIVLDKN